MSSVSADDWMRKRPYRKKQLRRTLNVLFGTPKKNVTLKRRKDKYFDHCYFPENTWVAVCFVAIMYGWKKMEAADRIMQIGLSEVFGSEIERNNQRVEAMKALGIRPTPTPFMLGIFRWAERKGYRIRRFFM